MKKLFIPCFTLCLFISSVGKKTFAQGINNFYLMGYYSGMSGFGGTNIDFISGSPNIYYVNRPMNFNISNANISNSQGNILFYTNGIYIADATNDTMQNGGGLNPSFYTTQQYVQGLRIPQADLILPFPSDTNKFYLFHETIDLSSPFRPNKIYFSIIDLSLNGGLGSVILKNQILYSDTLAAGQITACKHANGRDWWLVFPEYGHPNYYVYLVTPYGIYYQSKQNIGIRIYEGQASFSPDGTMYGMYDATTDLEIFDFDRCSGLFSNYRHVSINDSLFGYGFSFSPNSKIAYAASATLLYQFDLTSSNLASTMDTVGIWDSTYAPFPFEAGFMFMDIAPDNKVYMTTTFSTNLMHVINNPDSIGTSCDFLQHSITLSSKNTGTIPNFPNYFLGPIIGSVCDSLGLGITESVYSKNLNLHINPNPSNESFYLNYKLPTGKDATVYVYTSLGKLIHKQKIYSVNQTLIVHCNEWNQGMYFIKVVMDKNEFTGVSKIIIQH